MTGWSKPQEVTEAICEALKKNFVFKGISDGLLLEVGWGQVDNSQCSDSMGLTVRNLGHLQVTWVSDAEITEEQGKDYCPALDSYKGIEPTHLSA